LNPLFFLFVVLLMIFFLVVSVFLVLILVFSMSFGVVPHPWYYFWWIKPPFLFCCVVDGFLIGGFEFLSAFDGVVPLPWCCFWWIGFPPLLLCWWWSSPNGLELGIVEFLLVVEPLSYYSHSFYSTLLPWLCLLLHEFKLVPPFSIILS